MARCSVEMFDAIQGIVNADNVWLSGTPAAIVLSLFVLTFVSEDAACLFAGSLAAQGSLTFTSAIAACFAGIVIGDVALYGVGRLAAAGLLRNQRTAKKLAGPGAARARKWLEQRGASAVFISRFVTGMRLPTYLAAGFFRSRFPAFFLYFILAAAIWTPIAVGVTYFSSVVLAKGAFAGTVAAYLLARLALQLSTHEKRRLLVGRSKRIFEWEFWPVQIFYFPVAIYCACLAIRFRSLTVFTASNPGIVGGGLAGESKDEIYKLIKDSDAGRASMLKHTLIGHGTAIADKAERVSEFMAWNDLSFPIVLKPDVGERGKGVTIAKTWREVQEYLAANGSDTILQEHFDGVEASVFYYRFPTEARGRIFSITEKRFPCVMGDGISTLKELILNDSRAVAVAGSHFEDHYERLVSIPRRGESVQLIEIGTHSRGAIFLDGSWLQTEQLEPAIDEIGRSIAGFHFGRFDLRARSFDDFKNGGPFKIIELNGVSSESTNIYDPMYSIIDAYRILFRQWRLAFEIGQANADRAAKPTRMLSLFKLVFGSRPGEFNSPLPGS